MCMSGSPLKGRAPSLALLTGALFAAHPLMTEAITYTFQRHASLVATFYIMTIVLYSASRQRENRALYIASIVSAVLAMKTKENAFTLPLLVALYEFMFFRGNAGKRLTRLLPIVLTMAVIPLTLSYLNSPVSAPPRESAEAAETVSHVLSRPEYFYTQMPVVAKYLRMLVLPLGQSLDHAFTTYTSLLRLSVLLSMLLHLLMAGTAIFLWRSSSNNRAGLRVMAFGVLWFYIALSVESSFMPLQMIITEYRVYLPAAGIFLAASTGGTLGALELERRRPGTLKKAGALAIALVSVLGIMAFARNSTWRSELSIWQDAHEKNPRSARPALHVGLAHEKLGDFEGALKAYKRAVELEPGHAMAHYDVGVIYNNKGQYERAEAAFRRALDIDPGYALARSNLAAVLMRRGRMAEAEAELRKSIELSPLSPTPYYNIALLLMNARRYPEAEPYLMKLLTLVPRDADIINKLAIVFIKTARSGKARETLEEGIASFPGDYHLLINLASLEDEAGNMQEAERLYIRTIKAAPVTAYAPFDALGRLYIRTGRFDKALSIIDRGLARNPSDKTLMELRPIAIKGSGQSIPR
jgi:Flp pilus assembly protein TadD